ncbi:MAG: hypothetical protein HOH43_12680 [Candidatus Latescibacteria bacterium]|nr:hypothetical protein [Candidatus Latescibacterota bacterium]
MHYRILGRTGLKVSLLSLGSGGARLMGQEQGLTQNDQDKLVRRSLELGVNLFDTSPVYGHSEEILGHALKDVPRDQYILTSKCHLRKDDEPVTDVQSIYDDVETSLRRLRTDCIDIMLFHGMMPDEAYGEVVERLYPALEQLRMDGKIRYIGFSEPYAIDAGHEAALMGLRNDPNLWDVIMLKYGILNQVAATEALSLSLKHDVGIMNMAAVRVKLPDPALLEELIASWKARGEIPEDSLPVQNPLGWLVNGDVDSVISAGYKFAADHPAIATVLTGTATISHLEQNARALDHPALPESDKNRLIELFSHIVEYA